MSRQINTLRSAVILLLIASIGLFGVNAQEQDTHTTDDDALTFAAPAGWTLDVFDYEAQQAEMEEFGISFEIPQFGVEITLVSQQDMFATLDVTVFYGQFLVDFLAMLDQYDVDYTDAEAVLTAFANMFGISPDTEFETLVLADGREVLYYDDVYESDFSDMPGMDELMGDMTDMFGGMGDMGGMDGMDGMMGELEGLDDFFGEMMDSEEMQMFNEMFGDMFGTMDMDFVTRDTTRYYALEFDNTGVVILSVFLGSEVEAGEGQIPPMMEMFMALDADIDVDTVMAEFITLIQPGDGVPVVVAREPGELSMIPGSSDPSPSTTTGNLAYSLPPGYFVVEDDPQFGFLLISDEADVDEFDLMTGASNATVITVNYGIEIDFILDDYGLSPDVGLFEFADAIATDIAIDTGELSSVTETRIGAAQAATFSGDFDGLPLIVYVMDTPTSGRVLVIAFGNEIDGSAQNDIMLFLLSLVQ